MDRHVSERSPVRYRSVLLEMRRDAPPGLNMLYLSGLAETLALIDRENAQEPGSHDLNVRAIVRVLRAGVTLRGTPGLADSSWSFSTVAACTLRATRTDQIGDRTPARLLSRYQSAVPCRSCQGTMTGRF